MDKENITIKPALLAACREYIEQRIANAREAIAAASDAVAADTKSSAGDKFETTREMMQQELNRHQQLLTDASRMEQSLNQLDIGIHKESVRAGSLVITSEGNFFIAISIGRIQINGTSYWIVSPVSPLGQRLIGTKVGQPIAFNGKTYHITEIS